MEMEQSKKLAGKHFHPDMKNSRDETERGLAITHEQVADHFREGTVDALLEEDGQTRFPGGRKK
jgi:hypothetical protein